MKLTEKEIELISRIERNRVWRRRSAWGGLAIGLAVWFSANYFEWLGDSSTIVLALILGIATINVASAYSTARVDDKLNDALLRYVNNDPEALRQLSSAKIEVASEEQAQNV